VAVTTGEFGAWTPIGAEQVGGGYQVVWQFGTADQYIVWNLDSSGNYLSQGAVVSGNSLALESLEATFQQDLNHDLASGIVTTVIESNGSTSLVQVAERPPLRCSWTMRMGTATARVIRRQRTWHS
jgi:serralysin